MDLADKRALAAPDEAHAQFPIERCVDSHEAAPSNGVIIKIYRSPRRKHNGGQKPSKMARLCVVCVVVVSLDRSGAATPAAILRFAQDAAAFGSGLFEQPA